MSMQNEQIATPVESVCMAVITKTDKKGADIAKTQSVHRTLEGAFTAIHDNDNEKFGNLKWKLQVLDGETFDEKLIHCVHEGDWFFDCVDKTNFFAEIARFEILP
jgi:hypothetical protein